MFLNTIFYYEGPRRCNCNETVTNLKVAQYRKTRHCFAS